MKLAIFGGSGKTGQHLIQQALEAGADVTVLARTPSKVTVEHPRLRVVQGTVLDAEPVEEVIRGADAVISVLGPSSNKPEFTISRGMDGILKAMKKHGVRHIIISAGAGVRDPQDRPKLVDRFFGLLLNVFSKNVVADMKQAVSLIQASDRDWTVVRVPMLTDDPRRGSLKIGYVGDISPRLSRADMAAFILDQVNNPAYLRKSPAISN
ncbi:MAG: SDR family oxidoreductase [Anaerolineae bacterium]|nr:SDR family oxidoreductase [Anaerolineae bacterium]